MLGQEAGAKKEDAQRAPAVHYDKVGMMSVLSEGENNAKNVLVVGSACSSRLQALEDSTLFFFENAKGVICRETDTKLKKKLAFELNIPTSLTHQITVKELESRERLTFLVDSKDDLYAWMGLIFRAALPQSWPKIPAYHGSEEQKTFFQFIPKLKETGVKHRHTLLFKKLLLCSYTFNFSDSRFAEEKTLKHDTLIELKESAESIKGLFSDDRSLSDAIRMIEMNCLRVLPKKIIPKGMENEDDFSFQDPQWPHLQCVYEFFLSIINSTHIDQAILKKLIDVPILQSFVGLFNSEDRNERDLVKNVIHRIYGKLTHRRTIIRSAIYNSILEFVFETHSHNGIAEMLDILASIINGFSVPIREEHILTLKRTLIPLHKMDSFDTYHPQLTYCMTLFTKKDRGLVLPIIQGILRFWPVCNSEKELLLLSELEGLFECVDFETYRQIEIPFENRLLRCFRSHHFQVVEHSLLLYQNSVIYHLIVEMKEIRDRILPLVFPTLMRNSTEHWSDGVRQLSQHVLSLYNDVDPERIDSLMP